MSYTIEQKIGNHIYLYEVQSYWDSEKKQPRQRRKYLGKKDPETGQALQPRKGKSPRLSKDYGHIYLLQRIAEQIGLTHIVKKAFPDEYQTLLALAFFEISEAQPLYLFPYWVELTFLENVKPLNSKELTAFTQKMGRMESERLEFSRHWVKKSGQVQAVVFDITSLSSYSELLEYVEWGYNRDSEKLPQINLGVIYAENTNMPLHYQIYPGSIPDVSTLENILKYLGLFELKDMVFVLDRGFYSATNLSKMNQTQIKFIIPMPMTVKLFSSLLCKNKRKLSNPAHAFVFKEEVLFHAQESIEINKVPLQAHLYFNEQSRSEQTSRFLKKILELEAAVHKQTLQGKKEVFQYLSSHCKGASKFFQVKVKEGHVELIRKTKTLSTRMRKMGTTIMLSNHNGLGREKVLDLYRRKDYLEKTFDVLKNEFDGKRLRGRSKEAIQGRLFIKFISLILYSAIGNNMREKDLFKQYSVREIIYELKKLRMVEMNNGESYLTEVSKRQREIFNQFDVEIPIET